MTHDDRSAGVKLMETGTLVDFRVVNTTVQPSLDRDSLCVHAELAFGSVDEEFPEDVAEWGAFGFIFALAVMSFAEATPRGHSDIDYLDNDRFRVADLFDCLRFVRGELRFSADYIRGRCLKTDIAIRPDGTAVLETRGRGENALRWLDKLQGKQILRLVDSNPINGGPVDG